MINVIPKKIDIRICPQWQIMKFYLFWRLYYSEMLSLMPNGWHQLPRRVASSFFGECDIVQTSSKHNKIKYWLVVLTILKTMKVNGKDDIPYMKWKIKPVYNGIHVANIMCHPGFWDKRFGWAVGKSSWTMQLLMVLYRFRLILGAFRQGGWVN